MRAAVIMTTPAAKVIRAAADITAAAARIIRMRRARLILLAAFFA